MIKAFALAYLKDNKEYLLGDSDFLKGPNGERVVGAYIPTQHGNYYKQIYVGFTPHPSPWQYTMSFQDWWAWLKESLAKGETLMDDEFTFDPEKVKVVEFEIPTD